MRTQSVIVKLTLRDVEVALEQAGEGSEALALLRRLARGEGSGA
jgi:hypothetical protein